jgi:radical SAM protein with 4Fe4S-binding SPASM domain
MNRATLEITTMIGCPLMCNFCPQDTLRDAYGDDEKYMSLDTFKTAIDKLPSDVRVDFSGQAEAWVNPNATAMLRYALERGLTVAIYTTLYNWDSDTVDQVSDLMMKYPKQFENFSIHFPDNLGNMKGWKYSEEWEYACRVMLQVPQVAGIKFEAMTMSGQGEIHDDLSHLGIKLWNWQGHDRAGTLNKEQVKEQPITFVTEHTKPVTCSKTALFNQNVMLPNGDILLCCMDYDKKHVIGNLVTDTYEDLFFSDEMQRIITENARPCFTNESLCKSCTDARIVA